MISDQQYLCVGVCMTDPDSGYCLGCGRPPEAVIQDIAVIELVSKKILPGLFAADGDPDSPPIEEETESLQAAGHSQ